ncbi:glycosyltransferase [Streptomyces sp. NBC_00882]|uniref:glycosyltransferase n=1 Tax=Streptomyces sp. NBC_00882 TaxID=2975856 RepID=UPI00386FA071|nr:glycosyltransferase [Streptomyces sp. NBC_00882]
MAAERSAAEREAVNEVATSSAAIVAPTAALADRIDRLTGRRFIDRLAVIPRGIRLSDARVRDQAPFGTGPLSLVHAGRLDDNKSTITAVEALASTDQPHHLTVIGNGPLREHLEQRAVELGLQDRVHFDPFLPRAELWRRLPNFDAFVFTTRGLEAFVLVLIEAQAHGLPVAYADLPGVRETLGSTGIPYASGDPRSLAVVLDEMGRNFHRRKDLTKAALDNARRYDITTTSRQLRELTLRLPPVCQRLPHRRRTRHDSQAPPRSARRYVGAGRGPGPRSQVVVGCRPGAAWPVVPTFAGGPV